MHVDIAYCYFTHLLFLSMFMLKAACCLLKKEMMLVLSVFERDGQIILNPSSLGLIQDTVVQYDGPVSTPPGYTKKDSKIQAVSGGVRG